MLVLVLAMVSILFVTPVIVMFVGSFGDGLFVGDAPFTFPGTSSFMNLTGCKRKVVGAKFLRTFFVALFVAMTSIFLVIILASVAT